MNPFDLLSPLGSILGSSSRQPSASGSPLRPEQQSAANYYQQHAYAQQQASPEAQMAASRLLAQIRPSDILAQLGNAYRVPYTPPPPTEREIAVAELRECLGDDLWDFGYMEGLKHDLRDLTA